jgi:uncharacterized protein YggT (Ycf19 family)
MRIVLWLVRIYSAVLIAWALSSWFGGFPEPIGGWLNVLVAPVVRLFGWAAVGPLSLAVVIPLMILYYVEGWLKRRLGQVKGVASNGA